MTASKSKAGPIFGFLHIADLGHATWIGGYLVLNMLGRPVEFHCSEPVKANRAQQILYGETLRPFLFGEQIGRALLENSATPPDVVFVDTWLALTVRAYSPAPVVGVMQEGAEALPADLHVFDAGRNKLFVEAEAQHTILPTATSVLNPLQTWDLSEPFQRIREAVTELHKAA